MNKIRSDSLRRVKSVLYQLGTMIVDTGCTRNLNPWTSRSRPNRNSPIVSPPGPMLCDLRIVSKGCGGGEICTDAIQLRLQLLYGMMYGPRPLELDAAARSSAVLAASWQ